MKAQNILFLPLPKIKKPSLIPHFPPLVPLGVKLSAQVSTPNKDNSLPGALSLITL